MPSVRIKRTDYAQLDEQAAVPAELAAVPRSLANIFSTQRRPGSSGGEPTNAPPGDQGRPRRATVAGCSDTPMLAIPQVTVRRPRAGSRVADHVMSRASMVGLRNQRSALSMNAGGGGSGGGSRPSSARRTPVPSGMELFEGTQAGVLLPSGTGGHGILHDNLSQTYTGFSDTDEDGNHHDDVVEHLDVIGTFTFIHTILSPSHSNCRCRSSGSDSVQSDERGKRYINVRIYIFNRKSYSNLSISPALPFYSRKPVVFLASPSKDGLEGIAERGEFPRVDEDALDRHVEDVLARPSKLRRTLRGVWSFLKTRMLYKPLKSLLILILLTHSQPWE